MADAVRFKFTRDFDYHPLPGQTVAYLEGMDLPIPAAHAKAAEAAGAGSRVKESRAPDAQ